MRTRSLDRAALAWGAAFTVVGITFLLQEAGALRVRADVLLPVVLIIAGAVLVASGFFRDGQPQ